MAVVGDFRSDEVSLDAAEVDDIVNQVMVAIAPELLSDSAAERMRDALRGEFERRLRLIKHSEK